MKTSKNTIDLNDVSNIYNHYTSLEFVEKNGVYRTYVVYRFNNKRLRLYTDCYFEKKYDKNTLNTLSNINESVKHIRYVVGYIVHSHFEKYNINPSVNYVKEIYSSFKNNDKKKVGNILSFFDDFLDYKKMTNGEMTLKKFKTLKKVIATFLEKYNQKYNQTTYEDLNIQFFNDFINYLITEHIQFKRNIPIVGYNSQTAHKKLVEFRDYLKFCKIEKGCFIELEKIDLHLKGLKKNKGVTLDFEPDHLALTLDEIRFAYKYIQGNNNYINENDVYYLEVFIFLCLQGLNPVDLKRLTKNNIKNGYLCGTRSKTEIEFRIPLNSVSLKIFEKYNYTFIELNEVDCNKRLKVIFRKIFADFKKDNKNFNETFTTQIKKGKEITEVTDHISKFITLRTARYSFASNAIQMGLNPIDVQKMMGHKKFTTTQRYQHNLDKFKRDDVKSVDIFEL